MSTTINRSIAICPLHFGALKSLQAKIQDIEASLLLSRLKFHENISTIQFKGHIWIVHTRKKIAAWFGWGVNKVDRLLDFLEKKGVLETITRLWGGKKNRFIRIQQEIEHVPAHFKHLAILTDYTGSLKTALLFAKIAFAFNQTKIKHEHKKWCMLSRETLATYLGVSEPNIDRRLKHLVKKGVLIKKCFHFHRYKQLHFHIPDPVIQLLIEAFKDAPHKPTPEKVIHNQNDEIHVIKKGVSTIYRNKIKKYNNTKGSATSKYDKGNIKLDKIQKELTPRQKKYLESAILNTKERKKLNIHLKDLLAEMEYSILSEPQRKGVQTFRHAVCRFMRILGNKKWCTPFGFDKYCPYGQIKAARRREKEKQWELTKNLEINPKTEDETIALL